MKKIISTLSAAAICLTSAAIPMVSAVYTNEEYDKTISDIQAEYPDVQLPDYDDLIPDEYKMKEPVEWLKELPMVYQIDENISKFLEKYIVSDDVGIMLDKYFRTEWEKEYAVLKEVYHVDDVADIKCLKLYMGVVKTDDGFYHECFLYKNFMGYDQVLMIYGQLSSVYWREEKVDENILSLADFNSMSYEEGLRFAMNYYNENGDFLVDIAENETFNMITPDIAAANVSLKWDVNCDGKVTIADAAAVLQYLGNEEMYPISEQGIFNADIAGDGITVSDALAIQKYVIGL